MKTTIPQQLATEAITLSKETNSNSLICVNDYGELYTISNSDYKLAITIYPIIATVHYANGNKIYDERFQFKNSKRLEEIKIKAQNLKRTLISSLETELKAKEENTDWHKRFRIMKIKYGLDNYKIAEITGNAYNSVRTTTQPNKDFPRNLKLAIWISEQEL